MENSVNSRILLLKEKAGLENQEFCVRCKIATGTLFNIQNGGNVSPKTINNVAEGVGASADWIKTGRGKMYAEKVEKVEKTPYQDILYMELRKEIESWKAEYQWMKELVNDMRNGKVLGKLKRIKGTALATGTDGY